MHPVLGTMMPEICEAPHQSLIHLRALLSIRWDAFISFSVNQKVSAACANRNRLIINPLSNNRPADFPVVGSRIVVNGE